MGRAIALIRTFVRVAAPYIAWVARQSLWMTCLSLISLFQGFGKTSREISNDWTGTAIQRGMPMQFERALYIVCLVAAIAMNVIGWVLLSFLTTFIVRLIIF